MSNLATIRVELIANAQKFKTNVDKGQEALKKFSTQTTKTNKGNAKLQNGLRNVAGSIAAVQGPLGPVAGRISSIGAIMGRVSVVGLALTGVLVGIGAAFVKFVRAGANAESQLLKLQALLKSTGGAAGQTAHDIEAMAVAIGRGTLASVQGARDAAGVLLTFKTISGETFGRTLELTQDLAAVGFGSMKTAALQLGKALEDPVTGLSALRRVGVSFTESQKEQIKVLAMTGRQMEAQSLILDTLENQVGGAGKGAAGGLSGAFDTLGENITLFFEKASAGKFIVESLTSLINSLANAIGKFIPDVEKLPDNLDDLNDALSKQQDKLKILTDQYLEAKKNVSDLFDAYNLKKLEDNILLEKELLETIRKKIKLVSEEKDVDNQASDIFIKNLNKKLRKMVDEVKQKQAISKVDKELLRFEIEMRDKLIAKLGDSAEALEYINQLLELNPFKKSVETQQEMLEELQKIEDISRGVADSFSKAGDTIVDAFLRGKAGALDFKGILRELIISVQKTIIQVLILDQVNKFVRESIQGIFSPKVDPGIKTVGSIKLPPSQKAGGGSVQAGTPTMVGERGPELFVPNTGGVVKNNADTKQMVGSGGGINVTQNLNFAVGVTNTVRAEVMNMLPAIQQSTVNAVAQAKQRGGKFSKAFGS